MGKWRLLGSDEVLSSPWISLLRNRYQTARGEVIDNYYIVKRSPFVLVVARQGQNLIFVRQYRPATDHFYLALPAGYLQPGEQPDVAAKRELLEETGLSATTTNLIGELHPLPGYVQSPAHVVLCDVAATEAQEFDRTEIEEVVKIKWDEVPAMIVNGQINEMQAVAAIFLAREFLAAPRAASS